MVSIGPNPKDNLDLHFKLRCRLKVFNNESDESFKNVCSLLATATRFGLVFVGTLTKSFLAIQIEEIENKVKDVDTFARRTIDLPSNPSHLSVNCDGTKLCVIVEKDGCPTAIVYEVISFLKQDLVILKEIRMSPSPGVTVVELDWNPAIPDIMTCCKSDGSLGLYEFKANALDINELPTTSKTTCFCWSPKGKQIAIGSYDGKITQYKPDLKAVKLLNAPPLEGNPSIISLKWVSSFQFIGIYNENKPESESFLIVIDAPKTGNVTYTNYDDVCYSFGNVRPKQFFTILQPNWSVLMIASSNSCELGVLGIESEKWIQWTLSDESRAELPLSQTKKKSLPIGIAFNVSTTKKINIEAEFPAPMLLLLSHYGQLCCFYTEYLKSGIPSIYSPMDPISDKSGLNLYQNTSTEIMKKNNAQTKEEVKKEQSVKPDQTTALPKMQLFQQTMQGGQAPTNLFGSSGGQLPTFAKTQSIETKNQIIPNVPQNQSISNFPQNQQSILNFSQKQSAPTFLQNKLSVDPASFSKPLAQDNKTQSTPIKPIDTTAPLSEPFKAKESIQISCDTPKQEFTNTRLPVNVETEALIAQLVRDECFALETELKILVDKGKNLKIDIGTDSDSNDIANKAASLEEFLKALKETCSTQASEVHTLKQSIIQSWAWYEEARSRFTTLQDPMMVALLKCQPLDPASQRQLEDINHLIYYLDSQLSQANQHLDEQWDIFQDSLSKIIKVRFPTIDAVYRTMVKQNATLQKQKYILKEISNRIKSQKRNDQSNVFVSLVKPPLQYAKVMENQKKLTDNKAQKLHRFFSQKSVTQISISKPQLNNSTVHLTSLLAAPLSPIIPDKKINTKLDFVMSTPKPNTPRVVNKKSFNPDPVNSGLITNQEFTLKLINQKTSEPSTIASVCTAGPTKFNTGNANVSSTTKVQPGFQFSAAFSKQSQSTTPSILSFTNLSIPSSKSPFVTVSSAAVENPKVNNENKNLFSNALKDDVPSFTPTTTPVTTQFSFKLSESTGSTENKTSMFGSVSNSFSTNGKLNFAKPVVTSPVVSSTTSNPLPIHSGSTVNTSSSPILNLNINKATSISVIGTVSPSISSSSPAVNTSLINLVIPTAPQTKKIETTSPSVIAVPKSEVPVPENKPFSFVNPVGSSIQTAKTVDSPKIVTTSSIFGNASTFTSGSPSLLTPNSKTPGSIFGNQQAATTTSASIFGNITGSIFGGATSTLNSGSIFGKNAVVSKTSLVTSTTSVPSTTSSVFGALASNLPTAAQIKPSISTSSSMFGNVSSSTSAGTTNNAALETIKTFSEIEKLPAFVVTTPATSSVFATSVTSTTSIFGVSTATSAGSVGVLNTTTTTAGIFVATTTNVLEASLITSTTTTSVTTVASGLIAATSNAPSNFGTTTPTTGSIFVTTTTTTGSIFGTATTSTTSLFGTSSASTTSVFGVATTSTHSPFEAPACTTGSIFGAPASSTTTTGSIFATPSSNASIFGVPTTTSASSASSLGSVFGKPASIFSNNTSSTPFGGSTTTGSVFGTTNSSPFGAAVTSASPFGATTTSASPFLSIAKSTSFGASDSSSPFSGQTTQQSEGFGAFGTTGGASSFSFSNLNVGPATSTSSTFGSGFAQQTQNPFSRPTEQKSAFGGGSIFGAPAATTSSSSFSGGNSLFSKPASPAFGSGPVFGSPPAFGTQTSTFGNTNTFGGGFTSPNQGSFSSPGQSVQQTGFASPGFQKPGFGSAPVFGSTSPGFGSPPSFGGTPAFGSASTFGNPPKVFGGSGESSFGNMAQNSTFGNLANQNTVGFGNLAQQAATPNPATSFSGGSSFSSWR